MKKLSEHIKLKYKSVIDHWFINKFNGVAAYQAIYPNATEATAKVNFYRLQTFPEIKEYIQIKYERSAKKVEITQEGVLNELKNWIESDITETINLTSEEVKELPIKLRRLINKYKQSKKSFYDKEGNLLAVEENIELSFVSKERALEMINKHIGFYEVDNKQKANGHDLAALSTHELLARAKAIKEISNNEQSRI